MRSPIFLHSLPRKIIDYLSICSNSGQRVRTSSEQSISKRVLKRWYEFSSGRERTSREKGSNDQEQKQGRHEKSHELKRYSLLDPKVCTKALELEKFVKCSEMKLTLSELFFHKTQRNPFSISFTFTFSFLKAKKSFPLLIRIKRKRGRTRIESIEFKTNPV